MNDTDVMLTCICAFITVAGLLLLARQRWADVDDDDD